MDTKFTHLVARFPQMLDVLRPLPRLTSSGVTRFRIIKVAARVTAVRSRDSVVGIVTRYGLDGLGIESQWGRNFPHLSRPALRPTQPPVQ